MSEYIQSSARGLWDLDFSKIQAPEIYLNAVEHCFAHPKDGRAAPH
jgi:hypothetical protein